MTIEQPKTAPELAVVPVEAQHTTILLDPRSIRIESLTDIPSLWNLKSNDIEWLVPAMIPLGGVTLITGESGCGKTWLAHAIAGAVAHGGQFMGHPMTPRRVVYLDRENPQCIVRKHLEELGIGDSPNLSIWGGWNSVPPAGPDDTRFEPFVKDFRPLLIFDPLIAFNPGEEQSSTDTRALMDHFRRLANWGATVIIIHHTGKAATSKEYRGSSDFQASVDAAYTVEPTEKDGKLYRLKLTCFKSRFAPKTDFGLEFHSGEGFVPLTVTQSKKGTDIESAVARIIREHPGKMQREVLELARAAGFPKNRVLKCLAAPGAWSIEQRRGRTKVYYPTAPPPPVVVDEPRPNPVAA
jgi:hypothetical protein